MRQYLAKLLWASALGGCSIIYNPSSITGDAHTIDVEMVTDVNPGALELDSVFPESIYEGAGTDGTGSAPALVVVRGKQIAPDAVVTATSDKGTVTLKDFKVAHDANWIAVVLQAPVDMTNDEPATGTVTITVTQNGGATMATQTVTLKFLDQLKTVITDPPPAGKLYSQISVGALAFTKNTAKRVVLRSMSDVTIASIDASGTSPAAGPGGCAGGGDTADAATTSADGVACAGRGHHKGGSLGGGGGGGGYTGAGTTVSGGGAGGAMTGDDHISSFAANIGGGGGGGEQTAVLGGSPGGGGGGVVQIDARGNLAVSGAFTVKGGDGTANGGAAGSGGGGAGGTIVARAFGMLTLGTVTLDGGGGGQTGQKGGGGSSGRMRVDAAKGTPPSGAYVGPMMIDPPSYSTDKTVMLDVVGTANTGDTTMAIYKPDGNLVDNGSKFQVNIAGTGKGQVPVPLGPGYNKVCTTVGGGSLSVDDEATSCIEIAYLP